MRVCHALIAKWRSQDREKKLLNTEENLTECERKLAQIQAE